MRNGKVKALQIILPPLFIALLLLQYLEADSG